MASFQALPAYNDTPTPSSQRGDDLKKHQINRKSVAAQSHTHNAVLRAPSCTKSTEASPPLPPRPGLSLETSKTTSKPSLPTGIETGIDTASLSKGFDQEDYKTDSSPLILSATSTTSTDLTSSKPSASLQMKKAYEEVRHLAGGIVSRRYESTKHFTILRHSHGLVFYQGSRTSLAISIFSDEPLPLDRTLWLQSKGWTGKTGMRAKAFIGRNGNWLNVTPTVSVGLVQLIPADERAWQRDFQKFRKNAPAKIRDRHQLRETVIVRIPLEAGDGYFQLVLSTADKNKILCTSPAFRILSASMSPSSVRGASLGTLPLELGAMALATYGRITAGTAASIALSPLQSQVQQYMPSFWTRKATSVTCEVTGVQEKLKKVTGNAEDSYERSLKESLEIAEAEEVSLEEGPKRPYPINFIARSKSVVHDSELNLSKITVSIPAHMLLKIQGCYLGWARQVVNQTGQTKSPNSEITWVQAMFSATLTDISQLARVSIEQANRKKFALHIISESEDESISQFEQFEVQLLGFMRPDEPTQRMHLEKGLHAGEEAATEASMLAKLNDISTVQGVLDHPSWAADFTERELARRENIGRMETLSEQYADTRMAARNQIDKVAFHKAGVRVPGDAGRDKATVINGFYVIR
ncbi:hypothetical protein D0Z07_5502 [Hyphodiscus hymeniophilus]|uniref:Uncharacterized protein n=1 Tax=Hyphodiscus hymeniophilus TaxID=353542 RepID=A0A9P6VIT9_9HELO|nr:hypothetical protein D0Z07_5502 [Hyphodiscus hymeniophilus]